MGTGFTIDTPLKVAKYGISSVVSLVDDVLLEQMRKLHCNGNGEVYKKIEDSDDDPRARRVTEYLNLLDRLVKKQVEELRSSPFEPDSEITRYYEMLPESPLKREWREMLKTKDAGARARKEKALRDAAVPGSIDVNIMTKINPPAYRNGRKLPPEFNAAMSALRGFANSTLSSSVVFSAGINPRLYSYIAEFKDFLPDENGRLRKGIILKVSDYRSAVVQGRFLAKRGLWVSEFRVESGLNCGGHAFVSKGHLMGPILEEFKNKKEELTENLHAIYCDSLAKAGRPRFERPHELRITVQGGIGTALEDDFLRSHYGVDSTGWGTPFLLVPDVTNVDDAHLDALCRAGDEDISLSNSSPMGIPFWILKDSASEKARVHRIREGSPGSTCPKGFLGSNTEFTAKPICPAARNYQKLKLSNLEREGKPGKQHIAARENVLAKACICHDLGGSATLKYGIDPEATPAICCGPNIANLSKIVTLQKMVGHIYGRLSLITNPERPHMFIRELMIYMDYFRKEVERFREDFSDYTLKDLFELKENLLDGIRYYASIAWNVIKGKQDGFLRELDLARDEIENILPDSSAQAM